MWEATDQAVHTARMHLSENSKKQPTTVDINVKFICPKQKYTMCKSTYKRKNHNKHDKIVKGRKRKQVVRAKWSK